MSDIVGDLMPAESLVDFRRIADDLPWSIWTHRPDGAVDWANRAWYEFSRLPREIATGPAGWTRVVHPDDYRALIVDMAAAIGAGTSLEIELRVRPATGGDEAYRWFLVRAMPRYDASGMLTYWLGSAMDVHEFRARGEEQARAFQTIAEGIPEILWTARPDGSIDWYNRRWYEYTGETPDSTSAWVWRSVVHPDDLELVLARYHHAIATGEPYEIDSRMRRADGTYRWFLSRALPLRGADGEIERWCGTSVDVDDARRARAREQLYARMTDEMSATLSLQETLSAATRLVVPEFADYALVNLVQHEGGQPICVAAYHRDPAMQSTLRQLIDRTYSLPDARVGTRLTIRAGRPTIYERVGADLWNTIRPDFIATFKRLGLESAIAVPLQYRGRIVGSLSALMSGSGRAFTAADFPLFAEIARRIAPAIANAETYERERRVAQSFQRAAMVRALPVVPGLRFDAIYEAASAEATVGGDWYDAVRLPDGRIVLSIGDVAGSGLDAAVTMGSVRQSIRTAALINPEPARVLEAVDRIVRAMDADKFVTSFVALFDPVTFELSYASAGHPPPLLRTPDGTMVMLEASDLPLGLRQRETSPTTTLAIEPGSLLVTYTDGLTEFDRDALAGESSLVQAAARADGASAAHDIYRSVTSGRPAHDDVAVFTIALDQSLVEADGAQGIRWVFPSSNGTAAAAARATYAQRLRNLGIPENDVISAELIFTELAGNAYRYAPGDVEIVLDTSTSAPVLHVIDGGEGFEYRPRLPVDPLAERGRGLFLVRALAEEVSAERRGSGGSHVRVVLAVRKRPSGIASLGRDELV